MLLMVHAQKEIQVLCAKSMPIPIPATKAATRNAEAADTPPCCVTAAGITRKGWYIQQTIVVNSPPDPPLLHVHVSQSCIASWMLHSFRTAMLHFRNVHHAAGGPDQRAPPSRQKSILQREASVAEVTAQLEATSQLVHHQTVRQTELMQVTAVCSCCLVYLYICCSLLLLTFVHD